MSPITTPSTGARDSDSPAETATVTAERSYRYPGSPPFRDVDLDRRLFKGRDEEAKKVFHSILSSDVFLLYAVSGMGKSSLLNAGVMHRLRSRGFWPVSVRLNQTELSPTELIDRQVAGADIHDAEVEVARTPGLDFDVTSDTTLWDLLGSLEVWRGDRLQHLVLVLDQFEELFTLDWSDDVRRRFIAQFGEVVRGHRAVDAVAGDAPVVPVPKVKFVIVIREDSLGELEALADDVPQIMQNRFRLGALDATQAESAIREPAMVEDGLLDTQPFRYSEGAAQHILDFLQETERAAAAGIAEANTAHSVDPSQLQIICQYVERRVLPTKAIAGDGEVVTIEAADLGGAEGLRDILGDFYRRTVGTFPQAAQRSVRHLCEDGLISKSGRRLSLEREEIDAQYNVPPTVLHDLVDQRLLRVEPRVGSEYYELSHDTLVKPILADRSERRKEMLRRRRRFAFIAAGVVGLLVLGFLAYRLGFDEGSETVASLELDTPLSRSVDQPGAVERFQVVAGEQPSLILVEPSEEGLNAAVALTNSAKARRQADQLGRGQPERIVVPAGPGDLLEAAVSSSDASTGPFNVTLHPLEVTALRPTERGSEPISGSIDEIGSLAVFTLDVADQPTVEGAESSIEIVVTSPPQSETSGSGAGDEAGFSQQDASGAAEAAKPGEKPEPGLDVEIEVIDPAGVGTNIDQKAVGDGERTTVDGAPGQYLIVVRDHGTGTGSFEITATEVIYTTLSVDEMAEGEVAPGDVPAVFAIDVPANSQISVTVAPTRDLDPELELVGPREDTPLQVDQAGAGGAEVALLTGEGRHILRVTGFDGTVGPFEIVTAPRETQDLAEGETVTASAPAAFTIEVSSDQLVVVRPTSELDPVLEIVGPTGESSFTDSSGQSGVELAELIGEGQHVLTVSAWGETEGSFEVVTVPVQTQALVEGEPITTSAPVAFDVDVDTGQLFSFTAETADPDGVLGIQINGPDENGFFTSSVVPGGPATGIIGGNVPGAYRIIVASADVTSEITATLFALEAQPIVENEPLAASSPAVFAVEVGEDELYAFTARPRSAEIYLDIRVTDADGLDTGSYASSPSPGEPATVTLGGSVPGRYLLFVTSFAGTTELTATLESIEAVQIVLGSGPVPRYAVPAVLDLDLVAGERRLVIVNPLGDTELWLEVLSPGRDDPTYVYPNGLGQPVLALLDGAGTHQVRVNGSGGSFVIESDEVGEAP